ncbi:GNAT family N-acetyltransferase [Nonomuraea soli]|uniref:Ribosomal protein S18 acetylase RimI-like enzyme n=1 Tax=Nonomuraea soli TaxID=1032476 RepID=A0A7W0CNJ3_9ACTN|nr:GNAT family N-acetyltransferase [Nonomuraea soli]MBA2894329.1 ribosomal protein S18 acetylase RimI-like enzyme [Nonomuraea soli]
MTFQIRPAVPADARAIETVRITSWKSAYQGIVSDEYLDSLEVTAQRVEFRAESLADGHSAAFVAVVGGEIRGFSAYGPAREFEGDEVYAIYLLPGEFSTGMGRALMDATLDDLRARGSRSVGLWVLTDNARARRFYEAAGFTWTGGVQHWDQLEELHYSRSLPAVQEDASGRSGSSTSA